MYGARFADAWKGVSQPVMQRVWEKELAEYTMAEIQTGVQACKKSKFPPTLPEFLMMCRPPMNYELAYHEAVEQMALRDRRQDEWSNPAIYWAAARMGPDFKSIPYAGLRHRWQRGLDTAIRDLNRGLVGDVPPKPLEVAYAPRLTAMPDSVRALLASIRKPA